MPANRGRQEARATVELDHERIPGLEASECARPGREDADGETAFGAEVHVKLLILKAILTLLPLAPPHWHESQAEYETRARTMAIAIAEESRTRAEAMMVVTVFRWESSFAPDVHSGERLGDGGRAICAGQHHRNGRSEAEWRALAGTGLDATRRCVRATVRALRGSAHYCRRFGHTEPVNAFVKYGSGRRCLADRTTRPGDFRRRARTFARLMRVRVR